MALVKIKKRNKLDDTFVDNCLVIFIERDISLWWMEMT